jgi:hypothetical protein
MARVVILLLRQSGVRVMPMDRSNGRSLVMVGRLEAGGKIRRERREHDNGE